MAGNEKEERVYICCHRARKAKDLYFEFSVRREAPERIQEKERKKQAREKHKRETQSVKKREREREAESDELGEGVTRVAKGKKSRREEMRRE